MEIDFINFIVNNGFAVVVATFVLFRLEKSMKNVESALVQMTQAIMRIESRNI